MCNNDRLISLIDQRRADQARQGIRSWLLAPNLETYVALQRGEAVPIDKLRKEAVLRYGLRARSTA